MQLDILTPDQKLFSGEVSSVLVPGKSGIFEVLEDHAPVISTLSKGQVRVQPKTGEKQLFDIKGGVIEVLRNKVVVLAE